MIRTASGFLALLAVLPALQARDKPETPTPAQRYQALEKEYQTAEKEFLKVYKEAKTTEDKQKVLQERRPQPDKFALRFLDLAEKTPKDPAAVDALVWVVSNARSAKRDPDSPRIKAAKILVRDHVQSEKIAGVCWLLGYTQLRTVLEKSKHRSVQAQACLALGNSAESRARLARQFKDKPDVAKRYQEILGKEDVEAIVEAGPDKLSKEAEALYERAIKDFADETDERGVKAGKMAEARLGALRHPILVGKAAPEIDGEDIDGTKFKLGDYRGKVVLLDFWGNW